MEVQVLKVVDKPAKGTRTVFIAEYSDPDFVFMSGKGSLSYACGHCGKLLVNKIFLNDLNDVVLRCPKCERYNEIPLG